MAQSATILSLGRTQSCSGRGEAFAPGSAVFFSWLTGAKVCLLNDNAVSMVRHCFAPFTDLTVFAKFEWKALQLSRQIRGVEFASPTALEAGVGTLRGNAEE